jgi:hypothetical protein
MFDSHLTRQLAAARENTFALIASSSQGQSRQPYSHFACLVRALEKVGMMQCQLTLLGVTQAIALWEDGNLAQGRALSKW